MSKEEFRAWMVCFVVFAITIVFLLTYPEWRCERKAEIMQAYDWDFSLMSTGCMVKETKDSPWRDVVSS